ncbi:PTS sugar transporter subunit IIA [Enterococcus hulanensis]|uniref:PTS sugar transporter subunit IIA n=1 Tax=Enterococcus hulanensis TaxID=2559929 RepID=A0ABU3EU25_9ENTE|nr:PTS sugar transporter subunit IIA [Enterococcus hulanensis]MDT2598355.1 PTS sugar transporter subunit IIA [Enterococcus hulanensis]MDT2608140.1 PTS sugar transporter subunit IIA [Enterococcus hulanensis]MDT2615435.1 PTS sugar transporter subunit IIA [Enterococcus hulanensis]MDT2626594.1 PTS sugar transporter subunit IIA [Enterococcus hulanensis]MDT2654507.1 PTS sugar transporter subunit IIA [Enterococcus hulanensis]
MKLLVVSHGAFCQGILDSYQMIAGENKDIFAISLTDTGIQDFSERLNKQLTELESEDILILTDIKGGTPYNEAYKYYLSNEERIRVVAGMNLPMLIEVGLNLANTKLNDLAEMAIEIGKNGIEGIVEEAAEDNDLEF